MPANKEFKYKLVIFDWDGTIAKNLNIWLNAYQLELQKENIKMSDFEIVEKLFGTGDRGAQEVGISDTETFYRFVNDYAHKNLNPAEGLYPNVLETLQWLRNNDIKVAIASNSDKNFIEHSLNALNLEQYFDLLETANDAKALKPDPELLNNCVKYFEIDPNLVLMVGDSPHDVKAAKAAGTDVALFYPEFNKKYYSPDFIEKLDPTYILSDLLEVTTIVEGKMLRSPLLA